MSGQKVPLSSAQFASPASVFIMAVKGKLSKGIKMFMGERGWLYAVSIAKLNITVAIAKLAWGEGACSLCVF